MQPLRRRGFVVSPALGLLLLLPLLIAEALLALLQFGARRVAC